MKPVFTSLIFSTLIFPALANAADNMRACNQLGREIALRAAEEITSAISAEQRTQLAVIAESVCLDFQVADADAGTVNQGVAVASNASVGAQADAGEEVEVGDESEEKEEGSFLDLKLIDPADRVQRPGLKRR